MRAAGTIHAESFDGAHGKLIVWSGHWLAASCILLPGLWKLSSARLKSDQLVAAIPHRDALLIFSDQDKTIRDETAAFIREQENFGRKPITDRLVRLLPDMTQ